MPVEIRELVIRAIIADSDNLPADPGGVDRKADLDRDALIEECVRQVLKALAQSKER